MIVYLDVIFVLNFIIDFLLLYLTARFAGSNVIVPRLLAGSIIGALYTVLLFFPPLSFLYTFVIKLLFSVVMIMVTFGFRRWLYLLRHLALFYFVSFIAGGGMFALHYFWQDSISILSGVALIQTKGVVHPVTITVILLGIPLVWWISRNSHRMIGNAKRLGQLLGSVRIEVAGRSLDCIGLVDTGNRLYEPITRIPVMIIELACIKEVLPPEVVRIAEQGVNLAENWDNYENLEANWLSRIRLVPFRGVAKKTDFLLAVRPDRIEVKINDQVFSPHKILIGLNPEMLSTDRRYQAIIHPDIVTEQHLKSPTYTYPRAEEV